MEDIANENYWDKDAGSDVIRYMIGDVWSGDKELGTKIGVVANWYGVRLNLTMYYYQNRPSFILPFRN